MIAPRVPHTAHHKIVFAGAVGAGKTSAIQTISDVPVLTTEELATDDVRLLKNTTTVAMDYGQLHLENGMKIHLYGAPGQQRFDFVWEAVARNAIGVIVLVDDASPDPLGQLDSYVASFSRLVDVRSMVVGVTRKDMWRGPALERYRRVAAAHDPTMPVFTLDARARTQVVRLLEMLLYRIDPWIH